MGHVFLADDTRLGRKVALKVLSHEVATDAGARRRFEQEARTASALNHPHIVGLLDIGRDGADDFIVMEYVEGETLRTMLARGPIEAKRAIDLSAQAASGLAAAHDAQIVHRDIKPENLIVTRTNHLKILDFGLAKLTEKQPGVLADDAVTSAGTPALTRAGTIVGTAAYMSPEQAQSLDVDTRTDIFSLGAVLYESLTGARAFTGKSTIDTLHAVINREPAPAVDANPRLPLEVTDILAKALAKDPADRYRHAADFELDLRRLKRGMESGTLPSVARLSPVPRASWAMPSAVVAAALIAAAVVIWIFRGSPAASRDAGEQVVALTPLTADPGYEGEPTFSPDGETIAYVSDRTGNQELFLKQVSGGPDINISNNAADDFQPAFSPDGRQIAFVSTRGGASERNFTGPSTPSTGGDIWVMPALGGNARRIATGNFPSWSPSGSAIVYARGPWFGGKLFRVPASGGEPQEIPVRFANGFTPAHLTNPTFSLDGRLILFAATPDTIAVVDANGGEAAIVAHGVTPAWSGDARSIIYSNGEAGKNLALWSLPFDTAAGRASGPARPLTVGRGADQQPAASRTGARIAFSAINVSTHIEVQPFDADAGRAAGAPVALTSGHDIIYFFDIAPDGRGALFELLRGPTQSVGRVDANGLPVQLTSDPNYEDNNPQWSPDGKSIAFSRRRAGRTDPGFSLWLMSADGANPQQLVDRMGLNGLFTWMFDGRSLVHVGAGRQLFSLDLATRSDRRLTNEPGIMPVITVSPDNQWVIYQCVDGSSIDLHAVPVGGGASRVVVVGPTEDYHPSISASGQWLYYYPDHKNLFRVPGPAQGWRRAEPERITNWHLTSLSFIENPQLSRDGRQLAYSRGDITGDLWLMTLSR